jgi:predicted anti-sigma-YlaC factor YlaD
VTHPSVEAIAEHLEGALYQADDQRVREHLRGCAECADRAEGLRALPGLLRTAGEVPSMPEHLARRVDDAIADEARRRAEAPAPVAAAAAMSGTAQAGDKALAGREAETQETPVVDLDAHRRRRRRVLAGGLLAAAAATVVAVGLGDVLQTSQQAPESAQSSQSTGRTKSTGTAGAPPSAESLLESNGRQRANDPAPGAMQASPDAALPLSPAALIAGVVDAHDPQRPGHERRDCLASALGPDAARTGASYAVSLPGGAGTGGPVPGVVWLRPNNRPTEAVLVACAPRPRELERRGLGE